MTLDPSIDLGVDVLDEGPEPAELILINWTRPVLPDGQISDARKPDDPLPFVVVTFVDAHESVDQSCTEAVVSVHCLYPKGLGNSNIKLAKQFGDFVHRRILLLGRTLESVAVGDQVYDLDFLTVFSSPQWQDYGDDKILQRVSRYRLGLPYAKMS